MSSSSSSSRIRRPGSDKPESGRIDLQKPGKTPQGPTPTKGDVQQIRDKLARLIEQKPEKAATILSEWIEKPAALFRRKKDPKKAA